MANVLLNYSLLNSCQSCAISAHSHTLLKMGGKLLGPQCPIAIGAQTINVLLDGERGTPKYIQSLYIHYHLFLVHTARGRKCEVLCGCDHASHLSSG